MTKTICDICGKEMPTSKIVDSIADMNFCISSHGKIWDICTQCRISLNNWMNMRKKESEDFPQSKDIKPAVENFSNVLDSKLIRDATEEE